MSLVRFRKSWPYLSDSLNDFFQASRDLWSDFNVTNVTSEYAFDRGSVPVEILDKQDHFLVLAELPGVSQKDIKISLSNNVLTISGEKKSGRENNGDNEYSEISYGAFIRTVSLRADVDPERTIASFKDGVLEVKLAKKEAQQKVHKIEIKA
jgi:HSP20 family protein